MSARKLPEVTPPYEISEKGKTFVPDITEIVKFEHGIRRGSPFDTASRLSDIEYHAELAERVERAEQALITLRYLQQIEREKAADRSWLSRVLGWGSR